MAWHLGPAQVWSWARSDDRRTWATPLLLAGLGLAITLPIDGWIARTASKLRNNLGGDLRRELEALQQYGQFTFTLLGMVLVWQLDRTRRRIVGTWLIALLIAVAMYQPMKMLIGRPRPKFGDPHTFLGPLGQYPLGPEIGVRHAWEFWTGISSDLWSMPSSHTAAAMVMSCVLARAYPSIRVLAWLLVIIVGTMRVMTGAHYASDVIVGAAIGAMAVAWATHLTRRESPAPTGA